MSDVRIRPVADGGPDAPLVVLAHGLEDQWTGWLPLAAHLDPSWRVVALDLPWRSGNDYRWRHRSAADWLGDALDLLDARPDVLVAHSLGANAVLQLLCAGDTRPGPVAALVCPMYRPPRQPVTWKMFDRARTTFVAHIHEGVRARLGARVTGMDPAVLETMMSLALDRVGPEGFVTVFQQFISSAELTLGEVRVPTLLVAGGADPTLSPDAALALADAMPGGRALVTDAYDHFCHVRDPVGVAAQITTFVAAACPSISPVGELR